MTLLRIIVICIFLLIWVYKKKDLGIGLFISSTILGLFYLDIGSVIVLEIKYFYERETLDLLFSLILIFYFMGIWKDAGYITKLIESLEKTFKNPKMTLVLPSSLIGFIPIVGGAMMSAPLLEDSSAAKNLSPVQKTFLNYWFRHLWEYIMPTYPAIILVSSLMKISFGKIFVINFPLTLTAILCGLYFGLKGVKNEPVKNELKTEKGDVRTLIISVLPLASIIIFVLILKLNMIISLIFIITLMLVLYRIKIKRALKIFMDTFNFANVSLVLGVMCLKGIMGNTGVITQLSADFIRWRVPPMLLLFLLPFIIGMLTGSTVTYVGIAFPILLGYLTNFPRYLVWTFASGYFGLLISPTHYCLSLTKEYYKANWKDVYKILMPPSIIILLVAFLWCSFFPF
ncbi:MAG: DUF401 family protein [Elusimicrobia bacterium]|nr:DUF401 family protein [Elusimicrobiota bacterium]